MAPFLGVSYNWILLRNFDQDKNEKLSNPMVGWLQNKSDLKIGRRYPKPPKHIGASLNQVSLALNTKTKSEGRGTAVDTTKQTFRISNKSAASSL